MTDEEYFEKIAISKSQLKLWDNRNPYRFWQACVWNPKRPKFEETDFTVAGKLRHMMLFEPAKVTENFEVNDGLGISRKNKSWKAAQVKSEKLFVTTEETKEAAESTQALLKQAKIQDLLKYARKEAPFFWQDEEYSLPCKMKTDAESLTTDGKIICIDLKTTSMDIPEYIDKNGYQFEIGFYTRGLELKYKKPCEEFVHIIQSTKEPHNIRVKITRGAMLEAARFEVDETIKQIIPFLAEWQKTHDEAVWLPDVKEEEFEFSPWYDRALSAKLETK